ncbi:MAG TPA: SHOCT domain-containing protein [Acidimicrobiales bacterium]|nr:SHOCT domain-containing protein [Acidimicrobiales bacterium]
MPFVRRRPLLRAAAVGGVAYMGAKAGTNRAMQAQAQQAQAQQGQAEPAPPPPAAAAPTPPPPPAAAPAPAPAADDTVGQLQQLAQLHQAGALSDEEFAQAKARILGS